MSFKGVTHETGVWDISTATFSDSFSIQCSVHAKFWNKLERVRGRSNVPCRRARVQAAINDAVRVHASSPLFSSQLLF